jgi:DNA-binding SARP family transcriptional activator
MTYIRVLGPIDVVTDDGTVETPGRHERMLLGALVVAVDRAVRVDELAQLRWGDEPPRSRDNALQTSVSRLRALVGHDRITAEDHSYTLHATTSDLDVMRFEALITEATRRRDDPASCLAVCEEALALWRGLPFGDFAAEDPFRLEVIRLDELRLHVVELEMECELSIGNEELVVGRLQGLVEQFPYRERLWRLFIGALALGDRRVEALRACRDLRSILGEVGLEPMPEIEALEDAILCGHTDVREVLGDPLPILPSR